MKPVGSMFSVKIIALIAPVRVRVFLNVGFAFKEGFDSVEETHGAALRIAGIARRIRYWPGRRGFGEDCRRGQPW